MLIVLLLIAGPPLSVDIVMSLLEGAADLWRDVGKVLYVPDVCSRVGNPSSNSTSSALKKLFGRIVGTTKKS
jgi:hypothetical protein